LDADGEVAAPSRRRTGAGSGGEHAREPKKKGRGDHVMEPGRKEERGAREQRRRGGPTEPWSPARCSLTPD